MFETYSRGLETGRDAWVYNFSSNELQQNVAKTIRAYNTAVSTAEKNLDPTEISWTATLESSFNRGRELDFDVNAMTVGMYRPFCRQFNYFNGELVHRMGQWPKLFPSPKHPNLAIVMPQGASATAFSALMTATVPALTPNGGNQCFSLYAYDRLVGDEQGDLFEDPDSVVVAGYRRRDNITDTTLATYSAFYEDTELKKEDIFYYVYGLLHSPVYREQYRSDLVKMLTRIPKVKDFWAFSQAGRQLAELHLNYETVQPFALEEISSGSIAGVSDEAFDFYRVNKLSFGARKDRSRIIYNPRITLAGIPDEAFDYKVNGKSALEWIVDRYQVTTHKESQITNDPNDYCREVGNPRYIVDLVKRIVTVSLETNKIVASLPTLEVAE
jgi:predicted helicase